MRANPFTREHSLYISGLILTTALVFGRTAPPYARQAEDYRYRTMAFARPLVETTEGDGGGEHLEFASDDRGRIWAEDDRKNAVWMFQTALAEGGQTRSHLTRTPRSLLVASENGTLYEFWRNGRLRASARIGFRARGAPALSGGQIRVSVVESPGGPILERIVDANTFRVER